MEGDQEKPRVFKLSNSRQRSRVGRRCQHAAHQPYRDERTPPKLSFLPRGWVLMAQGVVH